MGREYRYHTVDGVRMTSQEISDMLGISLQALYIRRNRLGGPSYQCVVDMYRRNQLGSNKKHRFLIEGRWMTTDQIADMLGVHPHSLSSWRTQHRKPDGSRPGMEEAIAHYREIKTYGWQRGGGHPCKVHMVDGKAWTVPDVMKRFGKHKQTVYKRMFLCGGDMGKTIQFFEQRARREKEIQRRRQQKAEDDIMKILGY